MKIVPMAFRLKGHRDYIHGPDIHDAMLTQVESEHLGERLGKVKLTIHNFATKQCDLLIGEPGELVIKPDRGIAELTIKTTQGQVSAWLNETDREIKEKYDFEEKQIETLCHISGEQITIKGHSGYSPAEVAVSMTKQLHNKLLPTDKKWIVVGFDLFRPLKQIDASQLAVEFKQNFNNNKLTKSALYAGDEAIGYIFFSAVKR